MENTVVQEVAPQAPHEEMAINYKGESVNQAIAIFDIKFAKGEFPQS
jgi:hypothetical protein